MKECLLVSTQKELSCPAGAAQNCIYERLVGESETKGTTYTSYMKVGASAGVVSASNTNMESESSSVTFTFEQTSYLAIAPGAQYCEWATATINQKDATQSQCKASETNSIKNTEGGGSTQCITSLLDRCPGEFTFEKTCEGRGGDGTSDSCWAVTPANVFPLLIIGSMQLQSLQS